MPPNAFFSPHELAIFWSAKKRRKDIFSHLVPVIFATATVVAFVLLCNSRFNFHCYTQREATPTQKPARKWRCDLSRRLARKITVQRAFTRANQRHRTAERRRRGRWCCPGGSSRPQSWQRRSFAFGLLLLPPRSFSFVAALCSLPCRSDCPPDRVSGLPRDVPAAVLKESQLRGRRAILGVRYFRDV